MNNVPAWILLDLNRKHFLINSTQRTPDIFSTHPLKSVKNSKVSYISPLRFKKIPIISARPNNVKLEPIDFRKKCNNLWQNFETSISPQLLKYEHSKRKSLSPNLKKIKLNIKKKKFKHIRRASNPLCLNDSSDEEYSNFGIQCDLNSEDSENAMKISEDIYIFN